MKKHCVAKVLQAIWEIFLYENNHNYISYRFSYKLAFILFLSFLKNQKQESGFQQVSDLVTGDISVFCLYIASGTLLQSQAEFNRLLSRNFLTCYSSSYDSSMHQYTFFQMCMWQRKRIFIPWHSFVLIHIFPPSCLFFPFVRFSWIHVS